MYLGLRVKGPTFLSDLNQILGSRQIFMMVSHIKFHGNSSSGSCADTCGQTDKQKKDVTKVIGDFRDNALAPKWIQKCAFVGIKGGIPST
jgi:hypothetical protein